MKLLWSGFARDAPTRSRFAKRCSNASPVRWPRADSPDRPSHTVVWLVGPRTGPVPKLSPVHGAFLDLPRCWLQSLAAPLQGRTERPTRALARPPLGRSADDPWTNRHTVPAPLADPDRGN